VFQVVVSYESTVFEINNAGNYTKKLTKKLLNKLYNSSVTTLARLEIQGQTETLAGTMRFLNYNFITAIAVSLYQCLLLVGHIP
jgi:hypothetical protein